MTPAWTTADPLPPRQLDVLRFICAFIDENGYPPTLREICGAIGASSTNAANDHLTALEIKGWIVREPLKSRAIRVLQRPAP